jgi:hypothetical protein
VLGHVFYRFHFSRKSRTYVKEKSSPIDPIPRTAMQMRHSYYDDCFAIDAVDQPIRKTRQTAAANAGLNLRMRPRKGQNASNCPVKFIKKV